MNQNQTRFGPDPEMEAALRLALRPVDPPGDLVPALEARLVRKRPSAAPLWGAIALAACLLLVVGLWLRRDASLRRQRAAAVSAARIVRALRFTSDDLSRIQQRIRSPLDTRMRQQ